MTSLATEASSPSPTETTSSSGPDWNAGRGAATWGSGTSGIAGVISSANSLVGSLVEDYVGALVTELSNGNYVVTSYRWNGDRGAVTWGSGSNGISGAVSAANSLVGEFVHDNVGGAAGITALSNGNYVVRTSSWNNGRGAVTWGSGSTGITGIISDANSLVGSLENNYDGVGNGGITALSNGNYVVNSPDWNGNRGAVTWTNGSTGIAGVISSANSLVGSLVGDSVGSAGVTALSNGNYVVNSPNWNAGRGAVTWASGSSGITGAISAANSLVGSLDDDNVGRGGNNGITALTNGNYVVRSDSWNGDRGAVTWGSGTSGITGIVSAFNSLVGSLDNDDVGGAGITALSNGNYVVKSPEWNGFRGAVTWGSGSTGVTGAVSSSNSLVGSLADDKVGYEVTALSNGNYVVNSLNWNGDRGAVTWGSGSSGVTGAVSAFNSLVGSFANDRVGGDGITGAGIIELSDGDYVVRSENWNSGRGAVTWASGSSAILGTVSVSNSLVGSLAGDQVGLGGITALSNGNYVVSSQNWNGSRGAVTWGGGSTGITGTVSFINSLVGSLNDDQVGLGGITALSNGNYVVRSQNWNGSHGAATWSSGTSGVLGVVSDGNSVVGLLPNTSLQPIVLDSTNDLIYAPFVTEGGGKVRVGSQFDGFITAPLLARVTVQPQNRFPSTRVGKSGRPQILTVLNSGNGTLTGIVVTLMGSAKKDFKIKGRAPSTLASGASAQVKVIFKPKRPGTRKATLSITGSSLSQSVKLQGVAVP
jgi:hypothetical protein